MNTETQSNRRPRPPKPLLGVVTEALRKRIRSGRYPLGGRLPAERALEHDLNADRRTIRAAIEALVTEGMLERRRNCRPIVHSLGNQTDETSWSSSLSSSRLVALIMCSGDSADEAGTRQQRVFWAMNQILGASEYHAVFLAAGQCSAVDGQNALREGELLSYALSHGFGGVVLCTQGGSINREIVQKIARNVPLVLIDRQIPGVQADFAGFQNRQSVFEATWHLINKGHRRIALVSSGEFTNVAQERVDGYRTALGCAFGEDPYELILIPPLIQTSPWHMLDAIIRLPVEERPTAVVCESNDKAARFADYLAANNISVPEDISLIAFDIAEGSLPNGVILSTVIQPFEEVGRAAARLILRRIQNSTVEVDHIELPTDFIENNSVQPVAAARACRSSGSLQELQWLNEERIEAKRKGPQMSRFGAVSADNIA